jgi:hypothetical protein
MDEEYWKGQVDAKLEFIKEELQSAKQTLITTTVKNDADHEIIKNNIIDLKIKSSMWGAISGAVAAVGAMAAKYFVAGK